MHLRLYGNIILKDGDREMLNLIESFFGKMGKQYLKGIRVNSKEELEKRIYQYIAEVNEHPVVYHWTYKMDELEI